MVPMPEKSQLERFKEAARELDCDEYEAAGKPLKARKLG